jgi:carotenoid cleavage dioxygenase
MNRYLQDTFAPVHEELTAFDLEVTCAIPDHLDGRYLRIGPNPATDPGEGYHWFLGEGMVHGVRLENGSATMYHNRFVDTTLYQARAGFGEGAPGGAANQSNVSAIWHGGRLLTSGEVGLPYELDPTNVGTIGPYDFGGRLTSAFTAHPKIDPVTGRMHSFGYGFVPPYLTYHVIEPDGTMSYTEQLELPNSVMMHDFAITEHHAVVDAIYASARQEDSFGHLSQGALRLTDEEAKELATELAEVTRRWSARTRGRDPERKTYMIMEILQLYPDLAPAAEE